MNAGTLIATILRHDRKVTSYKIALIRSINDVVLGFPHIGQGEASIAIPLRTLARFWVAYYWPFAIATQPISQGMHPANKADVSFRPALNILRDEWEKLVGSSRPSDGYFLVAEFLSENRMKRYPDSLRAAFNQAIKSITTAIQQPIRYAGPDEYGVFAPPKRWKTIREISPSIICLPETHGEDLCVLVEPTLWQSFCELSLWIEALCVHEWCMFTENLAGVERGLIYGLLTDRPDNRRPLNWERNQVDILMMEGRDFICPWTGKSLTTAKYDLDHLLPLSVYPINELWNLVPSDPAFNQHKKRNRMPKSGRLEQAAPRLEKTYRNYLLSPLLSHALVEDSGLRFGGQVAENELPEWLTRSTIDYLQVMTASRNLSVF